MGPDPAAPGRGPGRFPPWVLPVALLTVVLVGWLVKGLVLPHVRSGVGPFNPSGTNGLVGSVAGTAEKTVNPAQVAAEKQGLLAEKIGRANQLLTQDKAAEALALLQQAEALNPDDEDVH